LAPAITQWPRFKEINSLRNEPYFFSLDEPISAIQNSIPQPSLLPQSSHRVRDEYAGADAGSQQRPPTPLPFSYDKLSRLFTQIDSHSQEIYDSRLSSSPNTDEVTSLLLLAAATNSNPGNRLNANDLPSVRIEAVKESSLNPWLYSIALIAFVLYARRRGSV
jgi:hypothetical protein